MYSRGTFILQYANFPCLMQQVDTTIFGLPPQDAMKSPYIASMGVYVFKTDVLLQLLRWRYPTANDFGSEIIPAAIKDHDVQVRKEASISPLWFIHYRNQIDFQLFCANTY